MIPPCAGCTVAAGIATVGGQRLCLGCAARVAKAWYDRLRAFRDAAVPALLDAKWLERRMTLLGVDTVQVQAARQHINAALSLLDAARGTEGSAERED